MTNVRLAYASAAVLSLTGVFTLVRANERLQRILGVVFLLSAIAVVIGTRSTDKRGQ